MDTDVAHSPLGVFFAKGLEHSLYDAAIHGDEQAVRDSVRAGADFNVANAKGESFIACLIMGAKKFAALPYHVLSTLSTPFLQL